MMSKYTENLRDAAKRLGLAEDDYSIIWHPTEDAIMLMYIGDNSIPWFRIAVDNLKTYNEFSEEDFDQFRNALEKWKDEKIKGKVYWIE